MTRRIRTGDFTTQGQIFHLSAMSIIIGAICAFIAIGLIKIIGFVTNLCFYHRFSFSFANPTANHLGGWEVFVPIVGALFVGLIARYGSEKVRGHGIPEAIEAMLVNDSKVQPRVAFWKPISAAISIGTGGPFGAEGPIIMTGGSFGSLLSQLFHLSSIERRILLVAGAAGGMSATFAAPISSVLFGVELLVFEFKPRSLVPIALASGMADAIRVSLLGPGPLFRMPSLQHTSPLLMMVSLAMGLVGSGFAIVLTWAIYGVEDLFRKLPVHWMWWPAMGAVVIGIGGLVSPRALGVGYNSIDAMLNVKLAVSVLVSLMLVKSVIWVIALGSGTSGGILAPILIIGGSFGGFLGEVLHAPHPGVWALLGMSAIFSGVTRTPLTSVIFPLELTHNLGVLLPLLIASSVACGLSSFILPRSILTEKIHRRGLHLTREYSVDPLQMRYARELAYKPTASVQADALVRQLVPTLLKQASADPWLSVCSEDGQWLGVVHVMGLLRSDDNGGICTVEECIARVPTVHEMDTVKVALDAMLESRTGWVRVASANGDLLGALTTDSVLQVHRHASQLETERQRVFDILPNFQRPV